MPRVGIIVPNMGIDATGTSSCRRGPASLADALFTRTQQRVLGLLYGQPERAFAVSEVIAASAGGSGAVQRELAKLAGGGLLTVTRSANQKRYQANPEAPIHAELVSIVQKTVALADPLREALQPIRAAIFAAFVYGSVAKRSDTARSDIDLMILSDTLGYADVMRALEGVDARLARTVNPTLYSRDEYARRIHEGNAFLQRVIAQPKLWLIGGEDDVALGELDRPR